STRSRRRYSPRRIPRLQPGRILVPKRSFPRPPSLHRRNSTSRSNRRRSPRCPHPSLSPEDGYNRCVIPDGGAASRARRRHSSPVTPHAAMSEDTFISHLVELRDRLLRSIIAIVAAMVVLAIWPGIGGIYDWLAWPMMQSLPEGTRMIATGVVSPILVPLKVTLLAGFLLVLPYVLYQAWAFIAPGLYTHEKRIALPLVIGSTFLFVLGIAYCYFVVFGLIFQAIHNYAP